MDGILDGTETATLDGIDPAGGANFGPGNNPIVLTAAGDNGQLQLTYGGVAYSFAGAYAQSPVPVPASIVLCLSGSVILLAWRQWTMALAA